MIRFREYFNNINELNDWTRARKQYIKLLQTLSTGYKLFLSVSIYFKSLLFVSIYFCLYPSVSLHAQSDSLIHYLELAVRNNPLVLQKYNEYQAAMQKVP